MLWWNLLREDFRAVFERDPATRSVWAVLSLHTGFWAVAAYRLQHAIWHSGWHWLARWLSLWSRWFTGVEIHPAVKAGRRLFIDHGMGIVIGETAELGDDVSIYQGVTLGGTSTALVQGKRHPTIGNNVIIGAGAKVLGAITVADNVRIGSNAVVVKPVPAYTTVVGIPAKVVASREEECKKFEAYAQGGDVVDPVLNAIEQLSQRIEVLEAENRALRAAMDKAHD